METASRTEMGRAARSQWQVTGAKNGKKAAHLHANASAVHKKVRFWLLLSVHTATQPQARIENREIKPQSNKG